MGLSASRSRFFELKCWSSGSRFAAASLGSLGMRMLALDALGANRSLFDTAASCERKSITSASLDRLLRRAGAAGASLLPASRSARAGGTCSRASFQCSGPAQFFFTRLSK